MGEITPDTVIKELGRLAGATSDAREFVERSKDLSRIARDAMFRQIFQGILETRDCVNGALGECEARGLEQAVRAVVTFGRLRTEAEERIVEVRKPQIGELRLGHMGLLLDRFYEEAAQGFSKAITRCKGWSEP